MYTTAEATTAWASIFFLVIIAVGTHILLNIFIVIIVEGFATDPEALRRFKAAILKARVVLKSLSRSSARLSRRHSALGPMAAVAGEPLADGTTLHQHQAPSSLQVNQRPSGASPGLRSGSRTSTRSPVLSLAPPPRVVITRPQQDPVLSVATAAAAAEDTHRRRTAPPQRPRHSLCPANANANLRRGSAAWDSTLTWTAPPVPPAHALKGAPLSPMPSPLGKHSSAGTTTTPVFHIRTTLAGLRASVARKSRWLLKVERLQQLLLGCVFANVVVLAMERAEMPSAERAAARTTDLVLTAFFAGEMLLKVAGYGLLRRGSGYLRSGWNVLDGMLVFISVTEAILAGGGGHGTARQVLRTLRALRALRPLRLVQRLPKLRQTVSSLFLSLRPLASVAIIGIIFYLLFGILGVQFFRGRLSRCDLLVVPVESAWSEPVNASYTTTAPTGNSSVLFTAPPADAFRPVENRTDCETHGGRWRRDRYHFDSLPAALLTLFVISSRDGWIDIMYSAIDARGANLQPKLDSNPTAALFFVAFLLVVGYFVLNMVVGVLVENFQRSMPLLDEANGSKRRKAKPATSPQTSAGTEPAANDSSNAAANNALPSSTNDEATGRPRGCLARVVRSRAFERTSTALVLIGAALLAAEFEGQPAVWTRVLTVANTALGALFVLEALLRIGGLGLRGALRLGWDRLDIGLALLSAAELGFTLAALQGAELTDAVAQLLQLMRVLRVVRVIRLVRSLRGVRTLLNTVASSAGHVANLGLLLLLIFFMGAVMSVELLRGVECPVRSLIHAAGRRVVLIDTSSLH